MLTISSGMRSASFSANSVLPQAVGPVRQTHITRSDPPANSLSPAAEKQPVELRDRDLRPGWAAVITLVASFGALHLSQ